MASKNGYTLIEILVVIMITATLSGILIIYSRTSEQQIMLFRDQAKIISLLLRTKSLAATSQTTTVLGGEERTPCAWGFHADKSTGKFLVFRDLDTGGGTACTVNPDPLQQNADNQYSTTGYEDLNPREEQTLGQGIKFVDSSKFLNNIVFIPPEPKIIINGSYSNNEGDPEAILTIEIPGSGNQKTIRINKFGQITTQ